MKGQWIGKIKEGLGSKNEQNRPQWKSKDDETLEQLKARMRGSGCNPDNYEFSDPVEVDEKEDIIIIKKPITMQDIKTVLAKMLESITTPPVQTQVSDTDLSQEGDLDV